MPYNTENIRKVTIMGLGLFGGGAGAAGYWAKQGKNVLVTDLRSPETLAPSIATLDNYPNIEYVLGEHREKDFTTADLIVVNPAVKPGNYFIRLAEETGVPVTTEIGIFIHEHQQKYQGKILAVSGSNGKSTTTALLANILSILNPATFSGGNIGGSLLSTLGSYPTETPAILELSSFQLHYLGRDSFRPDISLLTNLSPNHLDWHITSENYYNDKHNLLAAQTEKDYAILNYQDPILRKWEGNTRANVLFTSPEDTGYDHTAFIRDSHFILRNNNQEHILAEISALQLPGRHNLENALQALTAAFIYQLETTGKIPENNFNSGLATFTGLAHRQEQVAEIAGIRFINDSIATTPESTIAALNSYPGKKITIIAGGYDKKIPLHSMSREIAEKAASAVLIGQTAKEIAQQIHDISPNFRLKIYEAGPFEDAITAAFQQTESGIILLSPGCASYGMFTNFQQRGEIFQEIAQKISKR